MTIVFHFRFHYRNRNHFHCRSHYHYRCCRNLNLIRCLIQSH